MYAAHRLLIVLLVALLLDGCARRSISRITPGVAVPVGTEVAAGPTPPAAADVAGDEDLIAAGYHLLLRWLILPAQPADLIGGAWSGVQAAARQQGVANVPNLPALSADADADLATFDDAYSALLAAHGTLDESHLAQAALTSMAEAVNDCHTAYLSRGEAAAIQNDLGGQNLIPSLPLAFQLQAPYLIESVDAGSDADSQGVRPGDSVVSIDGAALDSVPLSQRKFLTYGDAGSTAQLTLQTLGGQRRTLTVTRSAVDRPLLTTQLYGTVGYIRIRTFTEDVSGQVTQAIATLQSQGAQGFVLDLRGNLGGYADSDLQLLSKFIPSGLLVTSTELDGRRAQSSADGTVLAGPPPLAVLIDGGSLSASELFAEAIQQYGAGELVGTPTPGCLEGSTFEDMPDGSSMQVTVETIEVGPQRVVVNNAGVQPDVEVPLTASDLAAGKDPQRDRAVADVAAQTGP